MDWTELYRPKDLGEVLGNPKAVKELREWAISWETGRPTYKAVVLMGPPGIGKTSTALALAREFNWGVVEMNASDQRNADAIRKIAVRGALSETFSDTGEFLSSKDGRKKLIVLDEADNIFGREDQGGIPAMADLIRQTRQPVILIVNDFYELGRRSSVIKTETKQIRFSKLQPATVRNLLKRIAGDQGVEVDEKVLVTISERSNGDLRAAIRDLQAVATGMEHVREEDIKGLGDRLSKGSMYDLMADIFQGTSGAKARKTMNDADEDIDYVMKWVDENIPLVYKEPEELFRAYLHLSRAANYLAWVNRRQYYGFWSYAGEIMTYGVCSAKSSVRRGYVQYNFPRLLLRLSRSKDSRGTKASVTLKIGIETHTSIKQAADDVLPYFKEIFKRDQQFRSNMAAKLALDQEEVAFLLEQKVDSAAVKHVMQELSLARGPQEDGSETVRGRLDAPKGKKGRKGAKDNDLESSEVQTEQKVDRKEVLKDKANKEERTPVEPKTEEPKGRQKTLFQF
ncbi:MAG: replication factor C large subunit [Methanomassiliicoccales archaeon]|nr:MAG: replication factor C large subunit [Methanomassiliicoccales archaeon]